MKRGIKRHRPVVVLRYPEEVIFVKGVEKIFLGPLSERGQTFRVSVTHILVFVMTCRFVKELKL